MLNKVITLLIFSLFIVSFSFAGYYARSDWNCNKWNIDYYKQLLEDGSIFKGKKIITKDVFETAIVNLEKYCNNEWNWAQTPIFANQIIDVAFRKVDGIKGLAYGVKLDPIWKQYREQINQIEQKHNTDPKKISELFKKTWGSAEDNIDANDKTLYWRYLLIWKEMESLSDKVLTSSSENDKTQPMQDSYLINSIYSLANKRYTKEMRAILKISTQNFYTNAQNKLYKQVNEKFFTKLWNLFDTFSFTLWLSDYIARRFIHGTDVQK